MVHKKRLGFGFSGYGTPIVPRAPRSTRRKKLGEEEKLCAFELLASVAGKLLEESEGSASSNAAEIKVDLQEGNEKEIPNIAKAAFKCENIDRGSCDESVFVPETFIPEHNLLPESDIDQTSSHILSITSEKLDCDMKVEGKEEEKSSNDNDINSKIGPLSLDGSEVHSRDLKDETGDLSVKDPVEEFVNTNSHVNSESSVKLALYRELFPCGLLQKHWSNVKVGIRDDDENFSGSNKPSVRRTFMPQSRIGHRRVRKMMTSRYWKTAPKLKDYEKLYTTTSEGINPFYRCRKSVYSRERFQQAPIKKRRLSDHRLGSNSISTIPEKVSGTSAYAKVQLKSKEHHVAVSIKSFNVPELYIEVPESATVGSLKRTVHEAMTAILSRGVRVGIVFQGKNVRDDNRTLLQAGISQCSNHENLGFTLEPSLTHISANSPELASLLCDATYSDTPNRSLATPVIGDSDKVLVSSFPSKRAADDTDMATDGAVPWNMALVPMSADPLAALPLNQKPKRSEVAQRRTRRPFSVTEVEALVEAVEKLGTGRWRDVKMHAFENADHRTYVDLKDKWKTLVHTANISPQQRRGEPVPHELLSRVLSAHSYWSHHQFKNGKLQAIELPRITDSQAAVGA